MAAAKMELPCDGEGMCRAKPLEEDTLTCKTCNTPWHVACLSSSRPQTLGSSLQWECPDCCSPAPDGDAAAAAGRARSPLESSHLLASIRAIEAEASLTDRDKAKKRQELMSRAASGNGNGNDDDMDLLGGNLNCCFCIQVLDRPVTAPYGHNFCLKCFQKWTAQGKRTCAKCRTPIPPKMAAQPRINSSLVFAIRIMARLSAITKPSTPTKPIPYSILQIIYSSSLLPPILLYLFRSRSRSHLLTYTDLITLPPCNIYHIPLFSLSPRLVNQTFSINSFSPPVCNGNDLFSLSNWTIKVGAEGLG